MTGERRSTSWTDSTSAQVALAAVFLAIAVDWLLFAHEQGWSRWVPAIGWLGIAAIWATRAIKSTSANRARTHS